MHIVIARAGYFFIVDGFCDFKQASWSEVKRGVVKGTMNDRTMFFTSHSLKML